MTDDEDAEENPEGGEATEGEAAKEETDDGLEEGLEHGRCGEGGGSEKCEV